MRRTIQCIKKEKEYQNVRGETYGLSWIQTMNVHNAFLFTSMTF